MTRTELIAALEAAEGPSRELDGRIYCKLKGLTFFGINPFLTRGRNMVDPCITDLTKVPHYTESIDAALSFTPEGEQYCLGCLSDTRVPVRGIPRYHAWVGCTETAYGATPAIALCIANFRALEAQDHDTAK